MGAWAGLRGGRGHPQPTHGDARSRCPPRRALGTCARSPRALAARLAREKEAQRDRKPTASRRGSHAGRGAAERGLPPTKGEQLRPRPRPAGSAAPLGCAEDLRLGGPPRVPLVQASSPVRGRPGAAARLGLIPVRFYVNHLVTYSFPLSFLQHLKKTEIL